MPSNKIRQAVISSLQNVSSNQIPDDCATLELYRDIGIDSRRFLKLLNTLEETLGVGIDQEQLFEADILNVSDLIAFAEKTLNAAA